MTLVPSAKEPTAKIYRSSRKIGGFVHDHLIRATSFPNLGIHERSDLTGFNWSRIPAILLELGYLTNPVEEALLIKESFQEKIAIAVADGILQSHEQLQF